MSEQNNTIGLKPISELLGMNFFIPSYQRGYRWTEQQVKDLLDDIYTFANFQCPPEMPNWKQRLIKEVDTMGKSLLDNHCSGHYFGIPNNQSCCYLFYSLQRPRTLADCFEVT